MNKFMLVVALFLIIMTLVFYTNRNLLKNFSNNFRQNFNLIKASPKPSVKNIIYEPSPINKILPKTGI